jgi:imidazoleglycerol-phosphate dehydratase/histidinol-phosphatase
MKVVFLDRDGTLIDESDDGKVDRLDKLAFKPGVFEGLRLLRDHGYELVIVTNQNGIGSDEFPWDAFQRVQDVFLDEMEKHGIRFFDVFICPHLEEERCECRKPAIGLVKNFLWECEVELEKSSMIGDRSTDVRFGANLGVKSFFLSNERFELEEDLREDPEVHVEQVASFSDAVEKILAENLKAGESA